MPEAPPIAITCECGESGAVPYGLTWTCESCGRRFDTTQIPAAEYQRRRKRMRRFQLELVAFGILLIAVFAPLVLFVESGYLILGLIVGMAWMFLYMPLWRRRVRRAAADAPRWDLRAE